MKTYWIPPALAAFFFTVPLPAELPPSEVSIQEAFTAEQEAARALDRISSLYRELTSLLDSMTSKETAEPALPRMKELEQQLNEIEDHQKANPDFREAIARYLEQHPDLITRLQDEEMRYRLSAQRCKDAGLLD